MNSPEYVTPLDAVRHTDLARVGGKAANLGELLHAGFPVPPGYVVTTRAYDEIVLGKVPLVLDDAPDASALRETIEAAEIPAEVASVIREAYRRLGAGPVAVRSSATAEDLPEAAFAGQQD